MKIIADETATHLSPTTSSKKNEEMEDSLEILSRGLFALTVIDLPRLVAAVMRDQL
jgi:hypothetical protein